MVTSCNASEGDRSDSHWRQPWTPVSATLVSEMADQKSLHWACNRHISKVGFYAGLAKPAPLPVSNGRVYSVPQWNYMSFFTILSEPSGSIPCVASSAITWVNLATLAGQPTHFFLSGCCMAQRRSLSGRSPFCQRKLNDSRKFKWKFCSLKATTLTKQKRQNTPTTMQSPASWQRREHACQPFEEEGNVCSRGWKMLQCLKLE